MLIDLRAKAESDGNDDQSVITDLNDYAIVTDAIAPVSGEFTGQTLAFQSRVFEVTHLEAYSELLILLVKMEVSR